MLDLLFPFLKPQFGQVISMHVCVKVTYEYAAILLVLMDMLTHISLTETNNHCAMPLDCNIQTVVMA